MLEYLTWLIFIISVAFTAGSIVLATRLRNRLRSDLFSTLLYYLVFIFTFGFYGVWGQVFIKTYLSAYIPAELISPLSDIAMLLGLPFLVFAWYMLILLSFQLSGRKSSNVFTFWFLFLNISALAGIGYYIVKGNSFLIPGNYYIVMNSLYSVISSFLVLYPPKRSQAAHYSDRKIISAAILIIAAIQSSFLVLVPTDTYSVIIYILIFFSGNSFIPAFFAYGPVQSDFTDEPEKNISFDEFCTKFEISPREKEIIAEICKGLSNQEISERLFISLQTVKDHTHRIYTKTNVKSRAQLMNLVRENIGKEMI